MEYSVPEGVIVIATGKREKTPTSGPRPGCFTHVQVTDDGVRIIDQIVDGRAVVKNGEKI